MDAINETSVAFMHRIDNITDCGLILIVFASCEAM